MYMLYIKIINNHNNNALNKTTEASKSDIRPIAVGETLRRLTAKCLCLTIREKARDLFQPLQVGVACRSGSERITHGLRKFIDDHWDDDDFAVFKVDMRNAFNMVSRQAILDECATFFPEILPWVVWCYGTHPVLWHPQGQLFSELGVQQGDPLGPLLFSLVLQKLAASIDADDECIDLLFHSWYLDDGVLAGNRLAVLRALSLIQELGPALGLHINLGKCELFASRGNTLFPSAIPCSTLPNLVILGAPVGDYIHCSRVIAELCAQAKLLLQCLQEMAGTDLQVAVTLLRVAGSYCRMVHLARATPPNLASDALEQFDKAVRECFSTCLAVDVSDGAWHQAQLGLRHGGLGLRSLSLHAPAAFIASLISSGHGCLDNTPLQQAVTLYNAKVSPPDTLTVESVLASPPTQKALSSKIDMNLFHGLLESASPANKARLLSESAPHAAAWLSVVPSIELGLHLQPNEYQVAVRWWLGLDTSGTAMCPFCPGVGLDPLGHHCVTCRHGGDVVWRHNLCVKP